MGISEVENLLDKLVRFETVSDSSNLELCEFVVRYLEEVGIATRVISDPSAPKASLLASIGNGSQLGLVLSAHTDVVPVTGQSWSCAPFCTTLRDEKIMGRGTSDMKGFIAAVLAAVPVFRNRSLATPIHLAFSYDEEVGCRGAPALVETLVATNPLPALCIVGEPTQLKPGYAHKGKLARRLKVIGRAGHSAMPHRAASALDTAVKIATGLRQIASSLEQEQSDEPFDPPYATLHIGSFHSGTVVNFVPDAAEIEFELRYLPGQNIAPLLSAINAVIEDARASIRSKAPEADVLVEEVASYPALRTDPHDPAARAVSSLAQTEALGAPLSFGTEGGIYSDAGIPTVICGPGDISRAHRADEWIGRTELNDAFRMMLRLADACEVPIRAW
ncbi:MAG: acetylornithine deacetylase [Methylobacteriaceae bacterium]|nr:acetylornithine deacetylase [Methylobacteriaceae bacterium]